MSSSYEINSFKNGISLSKDYIIGRMRGNGVYGLYTPNNIDLYKLTRPFLLKVSINDNFAIVNCTHGQTIIPRIIWNKQNAIGTEKFCQMD